MRLAPLVGSGDRAALVMLPLVVDGVAVNVLFPDTFDVGGPPMVLQVVWAGFLLDTWLGALLGAILYVASRRLSREEDAELAGGVRRSPGSVLPVRRGRVALTHR